MNYTKANQMLVGQCKDSRKIGNNTYLKRGNEKITVRLHGTDILTFFPDNSVVLDTGGWFTVTTKQRMNEYLGRDYPFSIGQDKSVWYVYKEEGRVRYKDGMVLFPDGKMQGGEDGEEDNKDQKLIRACQRYAKGFVDAMDKGKIGPPSNGDCWYCLFRVQAEGSKGTRTGVLHADGSLTNEATCSPDTKGKTLGESNQNADHILSHIEEKYYVPSLLARAIEIFPVSQAAMWWIGGCGWDTKASQETRDTAKRVGEVCKGQVQKAIYRYVKRQLGFAS